MRKITNLKKISVLEIFFTLFFFHHFLTSGIGLALFCLQYILKWRILLNLKKIEAGRCIVCPEIVMQHIWPIFTKNTHTCERNSIEIYEEKYP